MEVNIFIETLFIKNCTFLFYALNNIQFTIDDVCIMLQKIIYKIADYSDKYIKQL